MSRAKFWMDFAPREPYKSSASGRTDDMNGQPPPVPPNWKTHRLAIIVLLLVGILTSYFIYRHRLALGVQASIDSIHHAGFPATCAELDKWYPQPPAGENAADVYREAFAHYAMWTNKEAQFSVLVPSRRNTNKFSSISRSKRDLLPIVGMAKLPPRTEPLTPEMQKLVAEYLSDNAESLRLLHQASLMKSCRYPIDLSRGVNTLLPDLSSVREAARLLEFEAIQYTDEQRPQVAVESVVASLGTARSLDQEPILISCLVHNACQDITLYSLERILNRMPLTDAQLVELAAAIEESENQQTLTRALVGERCMMCVDIFQDLRTGKISRDEIPFFGNGDSFWPRFLIAAYSATGLLELDETAFLDIMERYVKATQLPPPESISSFQAVDEKMEHLTKWRVLARLLLPSLSKLASKAARSDAKIRDTQTALAVERYRLANGKLPGQLSDLVPTFLPAIPTDPFDGKPLRYKTLTKGYVVYSVGDDREDNNGTEKDSKGVSNVPGTDITFTVER
jgi:hypothetical protein